jgi:type VI secretion system protein ImpL
MIVLGIAAAVLVYLMLRSRQPKGAGPVGLAQQVDAVFRDLKRRLKRSGRPGVRSSRAVLLAGPPDGARTSLVEQSDLGAELLVGEVSDEGAVIPTAVANAWVAGDSILVEAGPDVLADERSWKRLLAGLRPRRWAPTFGRGNLPPRAVVVCIPMGALLAPDAPDYVSQVGSQLRERLGQAAQLLGVELPVYVIFTKVDRVPSFADFAAVLDREEAGDALGATLPFDLDQETTAYGERETRRMGRAFERLYRSLGRARLELLRREADAPARLSAYEFPRELNKVRGLMNQLLVELGRPTQLGVGPRVRGFYFTGVRAVQVNVPGQQAEVTPSQAAASLEATRIFSLEEIQAQAASAQGGSMRQAPQWLFVDRLLRDVIGRDPGADALTGSGTLVHVARRALLGLGIVALGVGLFGVTASFRKNAALNERALAAVRGTSVIPETLVGTPDVAQLTALDSLRAVTAQLTGFQEDGAPLGYRWGLYRGGEVREVSRRVYFDRFQRLLLADARSGLITRLSALEPGAEEDPGVAYDALKAYLVTAGYADRSTSAFMTPVLFDHWVEGRDVSPEVADLARAQFAFYADELAIDDPYTYRPDDGMVEASRSYIRAFSDDGRFYAALVDEASRQAGDIDFAALYPEATPHVRTSGAVPGAFTADGWEFVQAQLQNIDEVFALEDWVVGGQPVPPAERQALALAMRERYEAEYVTRWSEYLQAASIPRGGSVNGTANRLRALSANDSPILQLLALVSGETDVDSTVAAAFQPVHVLMPPTQTDRLIGDGNQAYVDALAGVGTALGPLTAGPAAARDPAALADVSASTDQAFNSVREVTQAFVIEGEAGEVGDAVAVLLESPIESARGLAQGLPAQQANAGAASFCSVFDDLTGKYPFQSGGAEASLDEFVGMFQPQEGALWSYYDRTLQGLLERRGSRYEPALDADPRPTDALVGFFNDAATFSTSLFTAEGAGPELVLGLRVLTSDRLTEVEVNIDGQIHQFTRTAPGVQAFQWSADRARNANISGVLDGEEVRLIEPEPGQWALFRLFQIAEWRSLGGSRFAVTWDLPAHNLVLEAEVSLNSNTPVLSRSFLSGLRCTSRIAR